MALFIDGGRGARRRASCPSTSPHAAQAALAFEAATAKAATARLAQGANVLVKKVTRSSASQDHRRPGRVAYFERTGTALLRRQARGRAARPHAFHNYPASTHAPLGADWPCWSARGERSRKVLEGYVERFVLPLANATDLPAAQAHHRSFRTAYERTTFKFGSYTASTKAPAAADLVVTCDAARRAMARCVRRRASEHELPCPTWYTATAGRALVRAAREADARCTTAPDARDAGHQAMYATPYDLAEVGRLRGLTTSCSP